MHSGYHINLTWRSTDEIFRAASRTYPSYFILIILIFSTIIVFCLIIVHTTWKLVHTRSISCLLSLIFIYFFLLWKILEFPQTVTHVVFGKCFDKSVANLPPNLILLSLKSNLSLPPSSPFPFQKLRYLRTLLFDPTSLHLPESLTHLACNTRRSKVPLSFLPHRLERFMLYQNVMHNIPQLL